MKAQINRKVFLQASIATTLTGLVGCAGENGTGDGDMTGDGDGSGGAGSGGTGTGGGVGTGGGTGSGGTGSGGDGAGTGGTGTGGDGAGTGGTGTGGDGGGLTCESDITVESSGEPPDGHTHSLTVTAAMLSAGTAVNIETGPAPSAGNHTHMVSLTAEEVATIKSGGVVIKFTCDGNDHEYVISCDPGAPEPTPTSGGVLVGSCD